MSCTNRDFNGSQLLGEAWETFTRSIRYNIPLHYKPTDLRDIVWVMQNAEVGGNRVKVAGSGWSIEDIAVSSDHVISTYDTPNLNNRLTYLIDTGTASDSIVAQRRIAHIEGIEKLVHVEAFIKIFDLNNMLQDLGLAMITLGGAQGQQLAGAISTSTHGSDVDFPALPGLVQAVHLVTTGGQELWIEPASNPLTDNDELLRSILPCNEIQIIREDSLFNAVTVGLGRFGVIYSIVLKVRPAYRLAEWTEYLPWAEVSSRLQIGAGASGRDVFNNLSDLLASPPAELGISSSMDDFRYLDLTFNPRRRSGCWLRRRWLTEILDDLNLEGPDNFLCEPHVGNLVLALASTHLTFLAAGYAASIIFAWKAPQVTFHATELAARSLDPHMTGGEALAASVNAIWDSQLYNELHWLIEELNQIVLNETFKKSIESGKRGANWNVTSGLTESAFDRNCYNGTSIEIIFGFHNTSFIDFIDFILQQSDRFLSVGYMSVRFSRKTASLLSMHNVNHDIAVSIEITSLQKLRDNEDWMLLIESKALEMGGRPHWGQRNNLKMSDVQNLYGENFSQWREQLYNVSGLSTTCSNNYTMQRGLEPIAISRQVTSVKRESGRVTHLCNEGQRWSPKPVAEAIGEIQSRMAIYHVENPITGENTILLVRQYLATVADDRTDNNLRSLPATNYSPSLPTPILGGDLKVTSIVIGGRGFTPWDSWISFLLNFEERWQIHATEAFRQVRAGATRFYIQHSEGERLYLQAREYLISNPNEFIEDNLSNLPDSNI